MSLSYYMIDSILYRSNVVRNLMSLGEELVLDIKDTDVVNYRATLGHKANHSFKKSNAEYVDAYHPRFGSIVALVSLRDITKGA